MSILEKSALIIGLIPLSLTYIHLQTVGTIQRKVNSTCQSHTDKIKLDETGYEQILAWWCDDDNVIWEVILTYVYLDKRLPT